MCSSNLDYRRFRFTLATFCSSQYLKELFISCFLSLVLRVKSDAKIRPFFVTFQIFFKVFSNFFFEILVIQYFELLKQRRITLFPFQHFKNFTRNHLSSLVHACIVSRFAGAKIRQTFPLLQIFSQLFFNYFHQYTPKA